MGCGSLNSFFIVRHFLLDLNILILLQTLHSECILGKFVIHFHFIPLLLRALFSFWLVQCSFQCFCLSAGFLVGAAESSHCLCGFFSECSGFHPPNQRLEFGSPASKSWSWLIPLLPPANLVFVRMFQVIKTY